MIDRQFAWVTHAPADYMLVFTEDPEGEHSVVSARFEDQDELRAAGGSLEGAEVAETELHVYCSLPGEDEQVLARLRTASSVEARVDRGKIAFVAVGSGTGTSSEAADGRRDVTARIVLSAGGDGPRRYVFESQCKACGEFRGKINVLPREGVIIDSRSLSCRCESIPCRYCEHGTIRRPLSEHFDPERRAGSVPWFGYLVPCGHCQAAARGPKVQMSV